MKTLPFKLYYWDGINFGDELNKVIFESLFKIKFIYTNNILESDFLAIGSNLDKLNKLDNLLDKLRFLYYFGKKGNSKLVLLGSGFKNNTNPFKLLRKVDIQILRGKLSFEILNKNGLLNNEVLLGDLGLLSSYLIDKPTKQNYKLGIVPHFNDLESPFIYDFYKTNNKESIIINVKDEPLKVVEQIASCDLILSSSLHGLIVADSFGIPNLWFENTYKNQPIEPRFKFLDYYSIYNICDIKPINIYEISSFKIENIRIKYQINQKEVKAKQQELFDFLNNYLSTEFR